MVVRTFVRAASYGAGADPDGESATSVIIHFVPVAPFPIAFAILEVWGTANGKTSTVDLGVDVI